MHGPGGPTPADVLLMLGSYRPRLGQYKTAAARLSFSIAA